MKVGSVLQGTTKSTKHIKRGIWKIRQERQNLSKMKGQSPSRSFGRINWNSVRMSWEVQKAMTYKNPYFESTKSASGIVEVGQVHIKPNDKVRWPAAIRWEDSDDEDDCRTVYFFSWVIIVVYMTAREGPRSLVLFSRDHLSSHNNSVQGNNSGEVGCFLRSRRVRFCVAMATAMRALLSVGFFARAQPGHHGRSSTHLQHLIRLFYVNALASVGNVL